ncbi:hypothetical protein B566_EDAN009765, partial [Ephemera danica]
MQQWTEYAAKAVAPPSMQPPGALGFPHPMFAPAMNPFHGNPYFASPFPAHPPPMPHWFMQPGQHPAAGMPYPPYFMPGMSPFYPYPTMPPAANGFAMPPHCTQAPQNAAESVVKPVPAQTKSVQGGPWIPGKNGEHSKQAIIGGRNQVDVIYVARILHQGSNIPGKLVPEYKNCFASMNGSQVKSREY